MANKQSKVMQVSKNNANEECKQSDHQNKKEVSKKISKKAPCRSNLQGAYDQLRYDVSRWSRTLYVYSPSIGGAIGIAFGSE